LNSPAINSANNGGYTALHWAVKNGMKEACEQLIPLMSPEAINAVGIDSKTALHLAAEGDLEKVSELLIDHMHVIALLNATKNSLPLQKMISKIIADFINEKFVGNECLVNLENYYHVKLLKLSQVVNQDLLKESLTAIGINTICLNDANNYIAGNYFELIGVCKSISQDNPISILAASIDCMYYVLSHLGTHNLFFSEICLSGVDSEDPSGS
jgi:ankyrin repeat protein